MGLEANARVRTQVVIPGGFVRSPEVMSTDLPPNAPSDDPQPSDTMPSGNPLLARILVVDDSVENVRLLIRILERGGYTELTGTTDPRSVLDRVKESAPDLIILDLHMPHTDGFAVMQEIRALLQEVPKFLVVTGEVEDEIRSRALARGADDVLSKPFQLDDVPRRVQLLLEADAHRRGRRSQG